MGTQKQAEANNTPLLLTGKEQKALAKEIDRYFALEDKAKEYNSLKNKFKKLFEGQDGLIIDGRYKVHGFFKPYSANPGFPAGKSWSWGIDNLVGGQS